MPRYKCLRCQTSYFSISTKFRLATRVCECGGMQFEQTDSPVVAGMASDLTDFSTEQAIEAGDHGCLAFGDEKQFLRIAVPYVREGFANGEMVMSILEAGLDLRLREELSAEERAAVISIASNEQYGSTLDPENVIRKYRTLLDSVDRPVRVLGGFDEDILGSVSAETVLLYERKAHAMSKEYDVTALCVYDKRLCDSDQLDAVKQAHPIVAAKYGFLSNPAFESALV